MKTKGESKRIKWKYENEIEYPNEYKHLLWDCEPEKAPLEKVILRFLTYPNINRIKWLMNNYPKETKEFLSRHKSIPRGAAFWVKKFYNDQYR